jgi:hypothetical protein
MSESNLRVVQDFYAAIARGDGPAAISLMDPSIVWNEAESFPYADRNPYIGPGAVAEGVFFRLATEWNQFQALPDEFLDAGDTIVVRGRYRGTYIATSKALDSQFAHVWHLRNGKVKAFQQYTDTAQASRVVRG